MRGRDLIFATVLSTAAAGAGVAGYRTAHVVLPNAVRGAIGRALGVEPRGVFVGSVRLRATGLALEQLTAGQLAVRHVEVRPAFGALLGGRTTGRVVLDDLMLEDPPIARVDRVRVGHGEVSLDRSGVRARGQRVVVEPATAHASLPDLTVRIAELGVELDRPRHGRPTPRRVAFSGMQLGPIDELAGVVRAHDGALEIRAAAPGVRLLASTADGTGAAKLTLEHRPLGPRDANALAHLGITAIEGEASGEIGVTWSAEPTRPAAATVHLAFPRAVLTAPRVAPAPLRLDGLALDARGHLTDDGAVLDASSVHLGALTLDARGSIDDDEDGPVLALRLEVPRSPCADVLGALPDALRSALDGMVLGGDVTGHVAVSIPLDAPGELELDGGLALDCRVDHEPPLADADRLRTEAPLLAGAHAADGTSLRVELGPNGASFRPLSRIPTLVVDTFVEAEDGRFFRHAGLDLGQIRRALAHDLETGAPGRGGSTITQQVAKNLFLSGERTFGRKLEEAVLAWRLEQRLGKKRILELYLNLIELGPGVYGVAAGAQHWFGKDLAALDADEVAMLAALLPAPRRGMDEAFKRRYGALRARLPHMMALGPKARD